MERGPFLAQWNRVLGRNGWTLWIVLTPRKGGEESRSRSRRDTQLPHPLAAIIAEKKRSQEKGCKKKMEDHFWEKKI